MGKKIPSEFVPLDVNYAHDRAIRSAGPMAELLFLRSLAYSRKTRTHGFIPDFDLPVVGVGIPATAKHAKALVRERLWVSTAGGWRIRTWIKWNPASTEEAQAAQSLGGALGNHNRWHVTEGRFSDDCTFCAASGTDRVSDRGGESGTDRVGIAEVEVEREKREKEPKPSSFSSPTTRGLERPSAPDTTGHTATDMMPRAAS